jgi:hypothetical protein
MLRTTRTKRLASLAASTLFLGVLLLYLSTLTQVHTFDALSYVTSVERKPWTELFHPHHLAYGPLGALALAAASGLGYPGGAAVPMQLINAAAGALGVTLFYRAARRASGRADAALAAALLMAGAYAYWYYAVEIEVYTLATLFLIVCLDLLIRPEGWSRRRALALGAAHGLATLFHQTNVLLCLPILVAATADLRWAPQATGQPSRPASGPWAHVMPWLARWSVYALTYVLVVALPYLYAMLVVSGFRSWDAAAAWLTEYARTGWWGGALTPGRLAELGAGLADTLAQPGGPLVWIALGAIAIPWGGRSNGALPRPRLLVLATWLLVYGAFFAWWEPDNIEFWIASLPPLLLLLALSLAGARPWSWRPLAAIGVAAAAVVTNYGSIERRGDAATDLQRLVARELAARSTPADLLVVPDGLLELYLPYYEGHENFASLNQALFDAGGGWDAACATLRARIDTALHAGATALIAEEALRPPAELLGRHGLSTGQVASCFAPYRSALTPLDLQPEAGRYFRLPTADELGAGSGWSFDAYGQGWRAANVTNERLEAGWRFQPGTDPALLSPLLDLEAGDYRAVEVRLANGTAASDAQLFFAGPDGRLSEERSARWELETGGEPVTYTIELRGHPGWEGPIARLRLDPVGVGDGGELRVEWIRLLP